MYATINVNGKQTKTLKAKDKTNLASKPHGTT